MIAAIVILYNPDSQLLDRLIESLAGQADAIYLIDNTPDIWERPTYQENRLLKYHPLGENVGIAKAQNIGMELAAKDGANWFLLLDQDSALSEGMVQGLQAASLQLEQRGVKVAAVGPLFLDEKSGVYADAVRHGALGVKKIRLNPSLAKEVETDYIIASGSLIRAEALAGIGGMMEELFIDWVDIEWGLRAKAMGYKSYIIPSIVMRHSIGDTYIRVLGREINLHNQIRNYYIVRNAAYLLRKGYMGWRWQVATCLRLPKYVVVYSCFSPARLHNFFSLLRACIDGLTGRLGPVKL
ncbi:glycosyltransferase family 2 protein [Cupriavidus sp. UYPR2.512]|uniref:glycosyltransferase family 2 protein n=1 Tax=Cupriavidus sp. UYPR2.512 TaxID=1080187 RepID=UPI00037FC1C2|nr:glycosyltransferase family 2 protein [Cupriavidus sp. UYPR2.512]UIF85432.1 glycosyltransferase family 2 protein [Cupriavidus necator]